MAGQATGLQSAAVEHFGLRGREKQRFNGIGVLQPQASRLHLGGVQGLGLRGQQVAGIAQGSQRLAVQLQTLEVGQQRLQRGLQCVGRIPRLCVQRGSFDAQRQHMAAPVVAHGFGEQVRLVGHGIRAGRLAAGESVLGEHALAPAVNGEHGGLVHPLRGEFQLARGAGARFGAGVSGDQLAQEIIRRGLVAEGGGSFGQARADALAQLGGGGLGECHHQDLRGQ